MMFIQLGPTRLTYIYWGKLDYVQGIFMQIGLVKGGGLAG